jgi:hypothetical protein
VSRDDEPRRDLRDLFAAAALTGLLAQDANPETEAWGVEAAARQAYLHADAMLAAREAQS